MNIEDQLRATITRQADRYEVPLPNIDGFATGAMRRRRRRMVAAGAACAVLGIVASGFLAGRNLWDTRGAGPADQPTSPTSPTHESTTSPSTDDRVGIVGPPPPGTPPTGPATGALVAEASLYSGGTWVYADGRIINVWQNFGTNDQFRGFMVRQLTPSGVEAMRSFLVDGASGLTPVSERSERNAPAGIFVRDGGRLMHVGDFDGCEATGRQGTCPNLTDPDWLPADAWEDPTFRPFVPHSYRVCILTSPSARLSPAAVLPAEAVDLLLGRESPLADRPPAQGMLCNEVTNPVARELAHVMDQPGPAYEREEGDVALGYVQESGSEANVLLFLPVLPHGGTYIPGG